MINHQILIDKIRSEEEEEDESTGDAESWINWFCSLKGNEFYVEVEESWIEDDFNLYGLSDLVENYDFALDVILDRGTDLQLSPEQASVIDLSAEILYGLIHARYILTTQGLEQIRSKYENEVFGKCPRVFCEEQNLLPVGQSDLPRVSNVKLYCPKCQDIYTPKYSRHATIDGAHFGTTLPQLFLQIYPELIPPKPKYKYVPRMFGFKVHKSSREVLLKKR